MTFQKSPTRRAVFLQDIKDGFPLSGFRYVKGYTDDCVTVSFFHPMEYDMLQLLRSFFGVGAKQEKYPERIVREAIERVAEKTDPWLKAAVDYNYKLRPAVLLSLDHVVELVKNIQPPIPVEFDPNGSCPLLAVFFTSQDEMLKTIQNDRELTGFLRKDKSASKQITALLMMEKAEKTIFGAELSGNVIVRDVPQVTVTFLNQRFLEPADNEKEARRKLEGRAFDYLLRLAHRRITKAKSERKDLERRRTLLQAKLELLERGNWNHNEHESGNMLSTAEIEEQLELLETKLKELGREDKVLDKYLDIAIDILSHPQEHLWVTKQHLILDQRGIKQPQPKENCSEFTFQELRNSDGQFWVMLFITFSIDDIRKVCD